ncbi:MBL fold metallo-hydrolase [Caenimonas koreensis DSM 17982]|uniref:MBL fold metallo-hydrolase n=1 Tax=Caenimonas koreensis DSM 17982 TaxID=1121255 RepID=A0A844B3Z4_9BURK|nr:MBL fold metallo-hydrolase [Caenimonas koreensis]MRD46409.1 MBL fold metallo-hydrolase [Caenimonas koreensis DSM 17982]
MTTHILKRLAWVAVTCTGLLFAAAAAVAQPLKAQQVADNAWLVQGQAALGSTANRNFISNAGFIVTPQGVVVIDALGSPALAEELVAAVRQVTTQPIRYVVVTHYHADHIYGLQVLKDLGATVIAQRAGQEYLSSETAQLRLAASRVELAPWIDARTRLVPADKWLDADTVLELGGEKIHIRHVGPAHTPEDLVVYAERAGVLFAGDVVFRGRVPYVGQADSRAWIDALSGLIALRPRIIVPGHGPMSTDPVADLELTRDYLVFLRKSMGEAAANLEPFEDAYARADWSRFAGLPLFRAANRINAFNTYLLMEQQAK